MHDGDSIPWYVQRIIAVYRGNVPSCRVPELQTSICTSSMRCGTPIVSEVQFPPLVPQTARKVPHPFPQLPKQSLAFLACGAGQTISETSVPVGVAPSWLIVTSRAPIEKVAARSAPALMAV